MRETTRSSIEESFHDNIEESQINLPRVGKPKAFYIVFGGFIFLTMIVGSIIFLAFLSIRKV